MSCKQPLQKHSFPMVGYPSHALTTSLSGFAVYYSATISQKPFNSIPYSLMEDEGNTDIDT